MAPVKIFEAVRVVEESGLGGRVWRYMLPCMEAIKPLAAFCTEALDTNIIRRVTSGAAPEPDDDAYSNMYRVIAETKLEDDIRSAFGSSDIGGYAASASGTQGGAMVASGSQTQGGAMLASGPRRASGAAMAGDAASMGYGRPPIDFASRMASLAHRGNVVGHPGYGGSGQRPTPAEDGVEEVCDDNPPF
eukprot:GHVU01040879.1.p1 GENE.GHVU01040879.1~~GHVU01040879.1.p1  ORF type:complete len:190 (+),score=20.32 GHVU01040879.1:199-768(+)